MTGSVPWTAAGALARTCVLPAVTTAVMGAVLTPATSWKGKGGTWVFMPYKAQKCSVPYFIQTNSLNIRSVCTVQLTPSKPIFIPQALTDYDI